MNNFVQCSVPTRSNQQIQFACFRRKSPRISFFPRDSHFNVMPGVSLTSNCDPQRFIPSYFPVEN